MNVITGLIPPVGILLLALSFTIYADRGAWGAQDEYAKPKVAKKDPNCYSSRDKVLEIARQKYGEITVAVGATTEGGVIEILSSKGGASWTMFVNRPDGVMCFIISGQGWAVVTPQEIKKGRES